MATHNDLALRIKQICERNDLPETPAAELANMNLPPYFAREVGDIITIGQLIDQNVEKPVIALRNLKVMQSLSDETHCYSAILVVDGVIIGTVENHGQGGADIIHLIPSCRDYNLRALDLVIAATYPATHIEGMTLLADLETACSDIIDETERERAFNREMKSKVLYVDRTRPGQMFYLKIPRSSGLTRERALESARQRYSGFAFLADMPVEEAKRVFFDAMG